jgi:hypothetical protein
MLYFVLHISLALMILIVGGFLLLRKKKADFWCYFMLGWFWQVVLSLPAGIWQSLKSWPGISISSEPIWMRLIMPLIGWPFNAGGLTVRSVFEVTVEPLEWLVGHRSSTVLSNMPYFAFLLLVQGSILAALFAWRYKKRGTYKNRLIICLAVLFLANSLLNVTWFWGGT